MKKLVTKSVKNGVKKLKTECGRNNTSDPVRSQAKIRHNRSSFTLTFIPFFAVTALKPDVGQ